VGTRLPDSHFFKSAAATSPAKIEASPSKLKEKTTTAPEAPASVFLIVRPHLPTASPAASLRAMLHVVLVEPEIPPNTGNIARLCLASGTRLHLVEPLGFSLDDRALRRAGMDYWKEVDVHLWSDFATLRAAAADSARFHFFTTKTSQLYWDADFRDGDHLVFGRETRGLPESLLAANPATCLTIPMEPGARSLNLSTSVGIALYEAKRQLARPAPLEPPIHS